MVRLSGLAFFAGLALAGSSALAQSKFDGSWSVLIITTQNASGQCDQGYRYPLSIENGRVRYRAEGGPGFTISGRVDNAGGVRVSISRGQDRVDASGRLAQKQGSGTWKASRGCSGRWRAERRG